MTAAPAQPAPSERDLPIAAKPYAVLLLAEPLSTNTGVEDLFLPLTFAYLLSASIRFVLPMAGDFTHLTDAAFDELLKGLSLESKGVRYARDCTAEDMELVLQGATLLLTTDQEIERQMVVRGKPTALISKNEGNGPVVKLSNLDGLGDPAVKAQLTACARLVNIQSGGYIVGGHFMLSW